MDLKLYLVLAGGLSLTYVAYNMFNKPRSTPLIPKDLTQRISQQIKHQIMILCISFSKAAKSIREDKSEQLKGKNKLQEILTRLRGELSQVYVAKENLILKKYSVSRETYGKSLQKWKHDKKIIKNTEEIINMMQRAINGQTPDFTVPQAVYKSFTRDQLADIYKQMVSLIGKKVTDKLQQSVLKNKNFNPNSDDDFRNAIRELQIYDVKVEFLKSRGFKEEWGCPNEVFFKYLEHEKTKDEAYEKKIVAYEKCYEKIIELVSSDPMAITDQKIDDMFSKALVATVPAPAQTVVPPVRVAPVVEAPKTFAQPARAQKKPQPVDQDAQLQAMMMQQLLSRSQQPTRSVAQSLQESKKIGLTSSEIQQDWQAHGSIHQQQTTKLEQATEEIAIGHEDKNLNKAEMIVVQEALKEIEAREEQEEGEKSEEVTIVDAPIVDVEPVVEEEQKPVETVVEVIVEEVKVVVEVPVVLEDSRTEELASEQVPVEESQPEVHVEESQPEAEAKVEAPVEENQPVIEQAQERQQ